MATDQEKAWGVRDHWKAMIAMTLVSLSSFQYGLDFGIIGGLQAMVPFLQVQNRLPSQFMVNSCIILLKYLLQGLREKGSIDPPRI